MESSKNNKDKNIGQVFTPSNIAELMAKLLVKFEPEKILDPSVGKGALIKAVDSIYQPKQLIGYDIEQEFISDLKKEKYNVRNIDFFDTDHKYDGIIMNPPYVRQEKLNNDDIDFLNKNVISKKLDYPNIPKQANLYIYFFWKALLSLEDKNSTIVSIMPNTWLTSAYGLSLQTFILSKFAVKYIINFADNVFEGFDVDVSIFVIKNDWRKNNNISVIDVSDRLTKKNIQQIIEKKISDNNLVFNQINQSHLEPFSWYNYREKIDFQYRNFIKTREFFSINRGITTNFNSFFIKKASNDVVKNNNEYFLPLLNKAKEADHFTVNDKCLDKVIFFTNKNKNELPNDLQSKIDIIEESIKRDKKPKTIYKKYSSSPNNWFNLSKDRKKSIVFNYIIRDKIKFILNEDKVIVKDNFYEMIPNNRSAYHHYIAILNSTFNKYFIEKNGRSYGTGLLKLQKYELEQVPLLDINKIDSEDLIKINKLGEELLLSKTPEKTIKKIDVILSNYYLKDTQLLNEFYEQYLKVIDSRKGKNNHG